MESLFDTINHLESESLQICSQVKSYLVSHREEFTNLFSLYNDAVLHTREVCNEVAAIIRLLSDRPIDAEMSEVLSKMKAKKEELKVKKELWVGWNHCGIEPEIRECEGSVEEW
ncbi:hypothetical protein VNO80_10946 [Phaseolus coccineus]|uniref:Uncharacterized protein n=1 Tax=Phaseolus coccineus TaxID=3886 RepID=A0AAN9RJY0_PHACN